jgi:16S rRNA processing protein RimM
VTSRPEWIEVGRISRPHGVRGEVRIVAHSDNPERFSPGSLLHARPGRPGIAGKAQGEHVSLTVAGCRGSEDYPILAFAEVGSRDAAEALRGYVLEVPSSQLPELDDDEFYPFDLQGLEVRDGAGAHIGSVIEVVDSPAHAILVLSLEPGSEVMVPFVKEAVPVVDVAAGYLVVDPTFLDFSVEG